MMKTISINLRETVAKKLKTMLKSLESSKRRKKTPRPGRSRAENKSLFILNPGPRRSARSSRTFDSPRCSPNYTIAAMMKDHQNVNQKSSS
ncbi:MAG: hypothetical protein EU535_03040 [Promethearchaeota archaeon]|nr:MAG: hypothetical protein EU535_03040 [Candidatus Lokiarchaeota archaeon]